MSETKSRLERFRQAKAAGKTEGIGLRIVSWREKGQQVVGELVSLEPMQDNKFQAPVLRYVLKTDEGEVSCILGGATDAKLKDVVHPGDLLSITFEGKQSISGGRSVNLFIVERVGQ